MWLKGSQSGKPNFHENLIFEPIRIQVGSKTNVGHQKPITWTCECRTAVNPLPSTNALNTSYLQYLLWISIFFWKIKMHLFCFKILIKKKSTLFWDKRLQLLKIEQHWCLDQCIGQVGLTKLKKHFMLLQHLPRSSGPETFYVSKDIFHMIYSLDL